MFTRKVKPIRIIGVPDNQRPDKWSSTVSELFVPFFLCVSGRTPLILYAVVTASLYVQSVWQPHDILAACHLGVARMMHEGFGVSHSTN